MLPSAKVFHGYLMDKSLAVILQQAGAWCSVLNGSQTSKYTYFFSQPVQKRGKSRAALGRLQRLHPILLACGCPLTQDSRIFS
jgi:hypothetical protein